MDTIRGRFGEMEASAFFLGSLRQISTKPIQIKPDVQPKQLSPPITELFSMRFSEATK